MELLIFVSGCIVPHVMISIRWKLSLPVKPSSSCHIVLLCSLFQTYWFEVDWTIFNFLSCYLYWYLKTIYAQFVYCIGQGGFGFPCQFTKHFCNFVQQNTNPGESLQSQQKFDVDTTNIPNIYWQYFRCSWYEEFDCKTPVPAYT